MLWSDTKSSVDFSSAPFFGAHESSVAIAEGMMDATTPVCLSCCKAHWNYMSQGTHGCSFEHKADLSFSAGACLFG